MNDAELTWVTRATPKAARWRARWQVALIGAPVGVAINEALWWAGLYSGRPLWRPALAALVVWLAMAAVCKLIERRYIRGINRRMGFTGSNHMKIRKITKSSHTRNGIKAVVK